VGKVDYSGRGKTLEKHKRMTIVGGRMGLKAEIIGFGSIGRGPYGEDMGGEIAFTVTCRLNIPQEVLTLTLKTCQLGL